MVTSQLSEIIALARAGALDAAWDLFLSHRYDKYPADPNALSVMGRLLKDRALGAHGTERRRLYGQSAESYQCAAECGGGTYPLINSATLSLLAGDARQAELHALQVLERIGAHPEEPET